MISLLPVPNANAISASPQMQLTSLRIGDVIAGRVECVHGGLAQLTVDGAVLEVRTSAHLVPGTTVKLAVKEGADGLVLELLRSDSSTRSDVGHLQAATGYPAIHGQKLLEALIRIGVAEATASTGGSDSKSLNVTEHFASSLSGTQSASPAQHAGPPERLDEHATDARSPFSMAGGAGASSTTPESRLAAAQQPTLAPSAPPPPHLLLPGTSIAAQITIEHEQEDPCPKKETFKPFRTTTIRLNLSSDALGIIQARLRQSAGAISASLWCERPEVAAALARERNELYGALVNADVPLDSLEIHVGQPPSLTVARRRPE